MPRNKFKAMPHAGFESEPEDFKAGPVDDTYVFVRSEVSGEDTAGPQPDSFVRIRSAHDEPEFDGAFICVAQLTWRKLRADFTCIYQPSDGTYADFQVGERSLRGGMEDVDYVDISFRPERKVDGEIVEDEVIDDDGNPFIFVFIDFGYTGSSPVLGHIVGKKALPGLAKKSIRLTEAERVRLEVQSFVVHPSVSESEEEGGS